MTKKIYKTAQGKTVDLGAIILQNEHVRAVGNMNVNARGDLLDGSNLVIDNRNQQVARQMERTTQPAPSGVSTQPRHTSSVAARQARATAQSAPAVADPVVETTINELVIETTVVSAPAPVDITAAEAPLTGLAAAMARSKNTTQERSPISEDNKL
jgi:hypothetical protein